VNCKFAFGTDVKKYYGNGPKLEMQRKIMMSNE